ncbi:MAG: hypothetical protein OXI63_07280 [Candidatus Poribacteria bacterium]|nr:hypothetical protein [Candidatus Poribacteria bacterium]
MTEKKSEDQKAAVSETKPAPKKRAPKKPPEPTFRMDDLMNYSEELFGVGGHVLVGARSGGFLKADPVTRSECQKAVKAYLASPVEGR